MIDFKYVSKTLLFGMFLLISANLIYLEQGNPS